MSELVDAAIEEAKDKMTKAVSHTQSEFGTIRTGRATPALVEKLRVDAYGSEVPLQQVAGMSVPEARLLVIQPYDKGLLKAIEKAIQNSDLGINPSNDGSLIRLNFPPLTEERRRDFVKIMKHKGEEGRVAVRAARKGARKDLEGLEKDGDITTDELDRGEKDLEKLTAEFVSEIDRMVHVKERELLDV